MKNLNELISDVKKDPSLKTKLREGTTPEQVASLAKSLGYDITGADILRKQAQTVTDLPDSELEKVAGKKGFILSAEYTDPNSTRLCVC